MINWLKRHKQVAVLAAALLATAVAVPVALLSNGPGDFTARGGESVCVDAPDVTAGTQVTVTDSAGRVIGTGTLADDNSAAAVAAVKQYAQLSGVLAAFAGNSAVMSVYTFAVAVPGGQQRYGVSTSERRGTVWFTEAQMRQGPHLSLGC